MKWKIHALYNYFGIGMRMLFWNVRRNTRYTAVLLSPIIINAVTGHFQTGGYSGGKYGEDKEPTDNVPEGHLNTIDAMDLACQRIGGTFDAKANIYLGHIDGEYAWHIEMETETIIYSMDMYTKTGEIVNYKEIAKS